MEITITPVSPENRKVRPKDDINLGFGRHFSDHMFLMNYNQEQGWHNPRIEPHKPFSLDPATMVLQYGQQVFEGLKAYRNQKGGVNLFRYEENLKRLNRSCYRMCIPELPLDVVEQGLKEVVRLDKDWIPSSEGSALYLRPTVIATDPYLGVRPSSTYLFFILLGPVAAYYAEGFNPVSIFVSDEYVRAVQGGTGEAKTAGNYSGSLLAQKTAREAGCSQVLWLDAKHHKYIEEVGTMNIFFRVNDRLYTSPLTGSILPGVTRMSVLQIAEEWGLQVIQQALTIDEVMEWLKDGSLKEVFGCGTAAIISPVKSFVYNEEVVQVGDGRVGELSNRLYEYLLDIQYGRKDDPRGWVEEVA